MRTRIQEKRRTGRFTVLAIALGGCLATAAAGAELAPLRIDGSGALARGVYCENTVVVSVAVDRDEARLIAYTLKRRPFVRPMTPMQPPRAFRSGTPAEIEIVLLGPAAVSYRRRIDVSHLCLDHAATEPSHIEGDTVFHHRDSFVAELPDVAGFDHVEIAYYRSVEGRLERRLLGVEKLDAARFTAAGGGVEYGNLAFAAPGPGGSAPSTPGTVHWPEEYGDPDIYTVYGDAAQTAERINFVIVPDGYLYSQKALMQTNAQALVDDFRARTPYLEHDPLVNYILVYAYSTESGTDECDCGIVKDTAMNTRFPAAGFPCGDSGNRLLCYGSLNGGPDCDPNVSVANIGAAELRAPADDTTVIMVNTPRYGGCGGPRSVYSAGDPFGTEIALHELGHTFPNLDDEYNYTTGCGTFAGEINTSLNSVTGAWSEWIADLGAPRQGAQYYPNCVYRPGLDCAMRNLGGVPFCAVCNQEWALSIFGHPRVSPTAPIASQTPGSPVSTGTGTPVAFSVATRLATGAGVTNAYTWRLQGPGYPTPTVVEGPPGSDNVYTHSFAMLGTFTLTCELVADTNFIKPVMNGANVDTATWTVSVAGSAPATPSVLSATASSPTTIDTAWTDNSPDETSFVLERSSAGAAGPFSLLTSTAANITTFLDTTAAQNTSYWYRVKATNTFGDSPYSNVASAGTGPLLPADPASASATSSCTSEVALTWSDSSANESAFLVERSATGSGGPFTAIATLLANSTAYTDGGLPAATSYWYRVAAVNGAGTSGYSNVATVTTAAVFYGDLNEDIAVNAGDAVIFSNFQVGNLSQGAPPFTAPLTAADLNQDTFMNAVDAVILANYLVGNVTCLPVI